MANSDISVPSVDHRQEPSTSTTFSIYGLAAVSSLPPLHSRSNLGHQMEHVSKIDAVPQNTVLDSHNGPRRPQQHHPAPRAPKQANPLAYSAKLPTSPSRPASTNSPTSPLSRQILAVNVANISNKRPAIRHIVVRNTRLWAISETCITHQIPLYCPWIRCHPASSHGTWTQRNRPRTFWSHHQLQSQRGFASIRQALDRVVPFDNNHPVLILETGTPTTAPSAHCPLVGHGLTVMQFSGSQITRLSTVHGRRHSSIDHFVCNAPARALLLATCGQTQQWPTTLSFAHPFEQRLKDNPLFLVLQPYPAITVSKPTDRIATSNYWDVLADGAQTTTRYRIHQLTSQFLESANAVADQLSLRLSPPATRSAGFYLAHQTCHIGKQRRQAFIAAATHTTLTQSSAHSSR
ncbi:hypothetical protein BASA83_013499 [Batrachochytrium salamandrivorans]|nr:hypothetical protein BASA83_013499 [Batrachochytrium salamandrivorans]